MDVKVATINGFDSALPNWHEQILGMWKRKQTPVETVDSLFELEWWEAVDWMARIDETAS